MVQHVGPVAQLVLHVLAGLYRPGCNCVVWATGLKVKQPPTFEKQALNVHLHVAAGVEVGAVAEGEVRPREDEAHEMQARAAKGALVGPADGGGVVGWTGVVLCGAVWCGVAWVVGA